MATVSCDKFLDKATGDEGNVSSYFPATQEDVMQLLNSIYAVLNASVSEYPTSNYIMYANIVSDDQFGGGGVSDLDIQAMDRMMYNDRDYFAGYWANCYEGIGRANMVITALGDPESLDEELSQCLGEAYMLRAYFYFTLAQMFENVPWVEQPFQGLDGLCYPPLFPEVGELYMHILQDLKMAYEKMFYSYNVQGRANKAAAAGLLARVYMFYQGFYNGVGELARDRDLVELELPDGYHLSKREVIDMLRSAIDNGGHRLIQNFRMIWPYSNEETAKDYTYVQDMSEYFVTDNREAVFEICCAPVSGQANRMYRYFGLRRAGGADIFPFNGGFGFAPVNPGLMDEWPGDDSRKRASVCVLEDELFPTHDDWMEFNSDGMEFTGYVQKKYQTYSSKEGENLKFREALSSRKYYGDGKTDLGLGNSPVNVPVLRYADMLLMWVELEENVTGMNQVRARAGIRPYDSYNLNNVQAERRYELAFEGVRWGDMRRWGGDPRQPGWGDYCKQALEKQNGQHVCNCGQEATINSSYAERYTKTGGFLDYPETEIIRSNGVLQHKDGWRGSDDAYFVR